MLCVLYYRRTADRSVVSSPSFMKDIAGMRKTSQNQKSRFSKETTEIFSKDEIPMNQYMKWFLLKIVGSANINYILNLNLSS